MIPPYDLTTPEGRAAMMVENERRESPTRAVLAPVDVAAVLAAMNLAEDVLHEAHKFHASPSGLKLAEARAAVERMAAELAEEREALRVVREEHLAMTVRWAAVCDEAVALRQRAEAAERDASKVFDNHPPQDCPCASQCLHAGCCADKCSLAAIALQEPRP